MSCSRLLRVSRAQCNSYATTRGPRNVPMLADASLETFRRDAFEAALPALLPRQHFVHLPATTKWFLHSPHGGPITLNRTYLARFGSTRVPLEITNQGLFVRGEQSFSFFLECVQASTSLYKTTHSEPILQLLRPKCSCGQADDEI